MTEIQLRDIAIIDDDPMVLDGLRDCMESAGYTVEAFGSAEEFLGWTPARPLSCLIVDIQLPGISGLELLRRLAAGGEHAPVVFVTAHPTDSNREQALTNGAAAMLSKPIRREELLKTVSGAIRS
jgi:FixJ family two-component response regulator